MQVVATELPEVLIVEPKLFGDQRGFFLETYQLGRYVESGIVRPFVQDNLSRSSYGVLRGLHLQNPVFHRACDHESLDKNFPVLSETVNLGSR